MTNLTRRDALLGVLAIATGATVLHVTGTAQKENSRLIEQIKDYMKLLEDLFNELKPQEDSNRERLDKSKEVYIKLHSTYSIFLEDMKRRSDNKEDEAILGVYGMLFSGLYKEIQLIQRDIEREEPQENKREKQ